MAEVAYVVSRWGEPTQTFVRREVEAVVAAGCPVRVLSMKRPVAGSAGQRNVVWLPPVQVATGVGRALHQNRRATLRTLASVVRWSHPRNVPAQLVASLIGLAWAARGLVDDVHIHAHFGWVAATGAWAASCLGRRPYSVVLHAFELHDRRRVDRFAPVPLRPATQVFTISKRDRELVRSRWGIGAAVVRMGVPREWLAPTAEGRDPWLIAAVGSLHPKKGHAVVVDAMSMVDERWRLVIIGEGPLRSALETQIDHCGLASRVTLLGHRPESEVRNWLSRAAVACLASVVTAEGDHDGVPVALMEAMASGAAVIATDVGAIPELVRGAGVVVPTADAAALARAIDRLGDPDERRRLASAGRHRVEAEFVADRAAAPIVQLIRSGAPAAPVNG